MQKIAVRHNHHGKAVKTDVVQGNPTRHQITYLGQIMIFLTYSLPNVIFLFHWPNRMACEQQTNESTTSHKAQ